MPGRRPRTTRRRRACGASTAAPAARAQFYIVRYGIVDAEGAHAKAGVPITTDTAALTYAYHVHSGTEVQINALAREQRYAFAIDAVNEVGITPSTVYVLHESYM